jgi:transcriptional regulator with XRE-family HTH domain
MSIVSNNIKYLRRLNGLTQEQFARKIAIKRSLLGAYEEARANPNLTNLKTTCGKSERRQIFHCR